MSIPRSDLPRVRQLDGDTQRRAVDAMWQAYRRAELRTAMVRPASEPPCPPSWVATMVEMLDAALDALAPDGDALAYARRVQPCDRPFPHDPHVVELTTGDLLGRYPCDGRRG